MSLSEMQLAQAAVDKAQALGASYADARVTNLHTEQLRRRNGALSDATECYDRGLGVRVLVDGAWGFA
ncbi:MAG: TldD protein, partial [Gammaproteobacteria bacterium]